VSRLPHKSTKDIMEQIKRNEEERKLWADYKDALADVGNLASNITFIPAELEAAKKVANEAKVKLEDFTGIKIP
jgi:hypothetical protein